MKKNDVKIILGSNTEELDGYDVVAARSKDGDEPSDYIKVQCRYSGNSKELILKGVPKGTGILVYMAINIWMDQIKKY